MNASAIERWLARCEPEPPERLAASLRALLAREAGGERSADEAEGPGGREGDGELPDTLVGVSAAIVRRLLAQGGTDRASALELLAADALATYAFEEAADEPARLEARCQAAMRQFAEIVDGV